MDNGVEALKEAGQEGIDAAVIIIYDSEGNPPDGHYCSAFKESYDLQMRVLYDPTGASRIYGNKETSIISNELGQIVAKYHDDALGSILTVIEDEANAGVGQCSTKDICSSHEYCLPTPEGVGKECTVLCDIEDDQPCPNAGDVCHVYEDGNTNGACFPAAE